MSIERSRSVAVWGTPDQTELEAARHAHLCNLEDRQQETLELRADHVSYACRDSILRGASLDEVLDAAKNAFINAPKPGFHANGFYARR